MDTELGQFIINSKWYFICPICGKSYSKVQPHIDNFNSRGDYRDTYSKERTSFIIKVTNHINNHLRSNG